MSLFDLVPGFAYYGDNVVRCRTQALEIAQVLEHLVAGSRPKGNVSKVPERRNGGPR